MHFAVVISCRSVGLYAAFSLPSFELCKEKKKKGCYSLVSETFLYGIESNRGEPSRTETNRDEPSPTESNRDSGNHFLYACDRIKKVYEPVVDLHYYADMRQVLDLNN